MTVPAPVHPIFSVRQKKIFCLFPLYMYIHVHFCHRIVWGHIDLAIFFSNKEWHVSFHGLCCQRTRETRKIGCTKIVFVYIYCRFANIWLYEVTLFFLMIQFLNHSWRWCLRLYGRSTFTMVTFFCHSLCTATSCNTLQHVATHWTAPQHIAAH